MSGVAADWRAAAAVYAEQIQAAMAAAVAAGERVDAIVRDLHRYAERQVAPSQRAAFLRACGLKVEAICDDGDRSANS